MTEKFAIPSRGNIVHSRNEQAVTTGLGDITPVRREIEAIGNWGSVDYFGIEAGRCIAADIAEIFGPDVAGLHSESSARPDIQLGLQTLVVHMPGVVGGENSAPIGIGLVVRVGWNRAWLDLILV